MLGLGSLALIRHEFRKALAYGRRARRLLPGSARPYGVIGDALVELGRYDEAFAAFDRMVSLRPSLASYARVAYARELTGDPEGALAAMRLALDAAAGQPEPTAWSLVELAKLELGLGRTEAARRHARAALRVLPGYPAARYELRAGRGGRGQDRARASPRRGGRPRRCRPPRPSRCSPTSSIAPAGAREARRQRATVAVIDRLLAANGVRVDLESAVYRADRGIRPRETVALARRARAERPSIYGDDALGWALARAGRCDEALRWPSARSASARRTRSSSSTAATRRAAPAIGPRCASGIARALALDPEFSVRWAPVARAAAPER